MLSVFITPWMKPTFIHCAISAACRSATFRSSARKRLRCGRERRIVPRDRVLGQSCARCRRRRARRRTRRSRRGCGSPPRASARRRAERARGSTSSPVAATARARVVGMPSACIASLTSTSRSIGPTAALPSPPRANGGAARALEGDVATVSVPVDHFAEKERAAVAELRRRIRRTGGPRRPAPAARRRRAACFRRISPPSRRRRAKRGRGRSSSASESLRNSSRGARTSAGCRAT